MTRVTSEVTAVGSDLTRLTFEVTAVGCHLTQFIKKVTAVGKNMQQVTEMGTEVGVELSRVKENRKSRRPKVTKPNSPVSPQGEKRKGRKFGPGQRGPCGWKDEIFRIFLCFPARPAGGRFFSSEKK
ncbi:hypothetical protein [Sunxiuqinia sp. sy24]|uniref:hypothetical protein n=1 Tax=Sunxiuqinia sp. sy24 TaxID=3461495 RepID=UPI004045F3FB